MSVDFWNGVLDSLEGTEHFAEVLRGIREGDVQVHGLRGSLGAFLCASLFRRGLRLVLAPEEEAGRLRDDLEVLLGEDAVSYFPPLGLVPGEEEVPSLEDMGLRTEALARLASGRPGVVVVPARAASEITVPPDVFGRYTTKLEVGEEVDRERLLLRLVEGGYERVPSVSAPGQFSVRGGILDVFPFTEELPIRVEFWGDVVESLRRFDVSSQRSVEGTEEALVPPARELILNQGTWEKIEEEAGRLGLEELRERASRRAPWEGMEACLPLAYPERATVLDYLGPGDLVFLEDPDGISEEVQGEPEAFRASDEEVRSKLRKFRKVSHLSFASEGAVRFSSQEPVVDISRARGEVGRWLGEGYRVVLTAGSRARAERISELVGESVEVVEGNLSGGFVFPGGRLVLLTEGELFRRPTRKLKLPKFKAGTPIQDISALRRGDLVVHEDYGIGEFLGVERMEVGGAKGDFVVLEYRDGDRLYVPVDQLVKVTKYEGPSEVRPSLTKLGGAEWERVKERVRRATKEMAGELLKLYAARKARPGHAFSPDTAWQAELDSSFPYEETPDQLRALREIKEDMERPVPMDRLLCGDVGFGKTEVALRAAFKAVMDGKQVAVLVPTTILAEQHFRTFSERLGSFPVVVEMLSRFRSPSQQRKVLEGLRKGTVDIVIGTHRLLSDDVKFKDLGLVIIDDEHRFGVRQKEKLKKLRLEVDVLSLSATPIPRTLYMALSGIRDMTVISTPPRGRLPVVTKIVPFDPKRITEGIYRELGRGGQVFFVHNRVRTIYSMADYLRRLMPDVRFCVAHGQMKEGELEEVMLSFLRGEYDVLVCTMIVEAGIDMPNVNTMFINRADKFGLAQLYQLRGRVGRSDVQAYAYLLVPSLRSLTPEARKRLRTLEEFTELGSGMRLALRDLEIRGAGNILGPEQHGFVQAVGVELYLKLLERAVRELKGEGGEVPREVELSLGLDAFLPEDYVPDEAQRLSIYRKLSEAGPGEVEEIEEELRDRFGRLPEEAKALIEAARLREMAKRAGARSLGLEDGTLVLEFPEPPGREALLELVRRSEVVPRFELSGGLRVEVPLTSGEHLEEARRILEILAGEKS